MTRLVKRRMNQSRCSGRPCTSHLFVVPPGEPVVVLPAPCPAPVPAPVPAPLPDNTLRIVTGFTLRDQTDRTHDLAGRTEPALQAIVGNKGLLHRMKPVALRHTLDREDVGAVVADRKRKARIHPPSVDDDGAGTTLAAIAALLGSCQFEAFAKKIQERHTRIIQLDRFSDAIHSESG